MNAKQPDKHELIKIKIDHDNFEVEGPQITAAALRTLPEPDIGADRDLFLTVHGPDPDLLIEDGETVELEKNMALLHRPAPDQPGECCFQLTSNTSTTSASTTRWARRGG